MVTLGANLHLSNSDSCLVYLLASAGTPRKEYRERADFVNPIIWYLSLLEAMIQYIAFFPLLC